MKQKEKQSEEMNNTQKIQHSLEKSTSASLNAFALAMPVDATFLRSFRKQIRPMLEA